jgi:predicted DNA-binding transcriptional regulator AlpA
MTNHDIDELAMLDVKEVEQLLRRKARTIRLMVSRGDFPKPIVSGRWLRADVVRHLRSVNEVAKNGKDRQDAAAIGISKE